MSISWSPSALSSSAVSHVTDWVATAESTQPGDLPIDEDLGEHARGLRERLIRLGVVPLHAVIGAPPGALAAGCPGHLLDEAVLGELAQMPGAVRWTLADEIRGGGRREGTMQSDGLEKVEPERVGQRLEGPRIIDGPDRRVAGHVLKDIFRKECCQLATAGAVSVTIR
jgi:hypothetical protein